ncbi:MAG TPA: GNAT family N-acetyltransferase [Pseudolabrys sp.]|nr:GNAT family N-acetyltransferase [Pseudolabrys sp.]
MNESLVVEKLRRDHAVEGFQCGQIPLDTFLIRYALMAQQADGSVSYVGSKDGKIFGYYTLVYGHIDHAGAPARLTKGLARHPIPLMVLGRLAVDRNWQGLGMGAGLLRDAMRRTVLAADIGGLRALAAHAKDVQAAAFYAHFGFNASATDPHHMFVLLKDVRRMLRE